MSKKDNISASVLRLCSIHKIIGGLTTTFVYGDLAEKLLSMKVEDTFDITCVKVISYLCLSVCLYIYLIYRFVNDFFCFQNQLLRVDRTQQMLSKRLFHIQLRKSSWTNSNVTQSSLTILSYTEKECVSLPRLARGTIKGPNRSMQTR
ncbi:hypothetical protein RDI58_029208 [Solanum bulbocastanum]|uniref:Uncharacterized protein n=1 Tax=Solanum bulbocastanum TaxID=147425 RepID=A0AAN8SPY5_SOLBU